MPDSLRQKVGSPIYAAYLVIITVLIAITVGAWLRLNQIRDNVDHFTEEVAENLILAAEIESQILQVRAAANAYIFSQGERDLLNYRSSYLILETLLVEAENQIGDAEQREFLEHATEDAEAFNSNFEAIQLSLLERERIEAEILHPQEEMILEEIEQLEAFAEIEGDDSLKLTLTGLEFAIEQLHLNSEHYVIDFRPDVRALVGESFEAAEEILPQLELGFSGEGQQASIGRIRAALEMYEMGFNDLAAVTQETISREANLRQLEPLIITDIHALVDLARQEMADENAVTEKLLVETRWSIVIAAGVAVVIGFVSTQLFARQVRLRFKRAIAEAQLTTERELNRRLTNENVRMHAELDVTRRLQGMLLPTAEELAAIKGLDVAGYMEPADEVGGDYYDVLAKNDSLKIGIGDVTGHGLESGVMMLMTQSAVRALLNAELEEPSRFMDVVNQTIYGNAKRMQTGRALTLSLLDYSPSINSDGGGQLTVSGYHEEVIIVRQNGQVERLDTAELGVPVGLVDEMVDLVQRAEIKLDPGDGIALYTDGITEAENVNGEQYGLDRLCRVLSDHWTERAAVIIEVAVGDVRDFMGERPQFDDLTLVVLKQE